MQIRVNAEPAAFYRLVVLMSLYPQKDCPSSEYPCCVHISQRNPSSVAEIIHSNWRQLSFLCVPSNSLKGKYRFVAGLEAITGVLPGPYLEDCSKSYCIRFRWGPVACCFWPCPAAACLHVFCGCASCYLATLHLLCSSCSVCALTICCAGALNLLNAFIPELSTQSGAWQPLPHLVRPWSLLNCCLVHQEKRCEFGVACLRVAGGCCFSLVTSLPLPYMLQNCTSSRNCGTCPLSSLPCPWSVFGSFMQYWARISSVVLLSPHGLISKSLIS